MKSNKLIAKVKIKVTFYIIKLFSSFFPNYIYTFYIKEDLRFKYPLNTGVGRALFIGNFEVPELAFVRSLLKPGDTVIDIGANGGLYTLVAARSVGDNGRVYACEPSQRELNLLKKNIDLNKINNVHIIEAAISSNNGVLDFGIAKDGAMNSLLKTKHPSQGEITSWESVKSLTLDTLISSREIENIALVKIDVEGAEKLVFEGATHLLDSQNPPVFLFESFHLSSKSFGYSPSDLLNFLFARGFNIYYFYSETSEFLKPLKLDNEELDSTIYNFVASKKILI